MRRTTWWQVLVLIAVIALVGWRFAAGQTDADLPEPPDSTVSVAAVPPEVGETLELIDAGGPFRYQRDGAVFMNREGLLPEHPRGYWREYTVPTPGEDDRGARRLVVGRGGQTYYSDDHYASFRRLDRQGP